MEASFADSMYYTFSTISQVLAGFIALSGVFVIFKIQEIKRNQFLTAKYCYSLLTNIKEFASSDARHIDKEINKLNRFIESENLVSTNNALDGIISNKNISEKYPKMIKTLKTKHEMIQSLEKRRTSLLLPTKMSMIVGTITILFSISILSLVHQLKDNAILNTTFFVGALFGAGTSIYYMMKTIFLSMEDLQIELND